MRKNIAWLVYALFVLIAFFNNENEHPFISSGPYSAGKYLIWLFFISFTIYSYHCSRNENLFRTVKTMQGLYWGRQIGIDLYIGLFLFIGLIYLHQQSGLVAVLWILPVLAFGNLASLLYVSLHYDSLIRWLTSNSLNLLLY